ncbi:MULTISPECIES: hypothetical protein [unclassified Agrobacterium]|uniref:hypothetical protein n=1 Tax=unclassified Agrobacterium TaxID=2632611 RepID=UPI0008584672|nr:MULTISPECIES: hypothetical protein [unclassified Agrobacterium]AOG09159.1 hypothetical protein BSY240_74 [Agrobacterium sp. RAC06]QGG91047.1 hypothetical protein GH983_11475 [Agrobacterium sp. MA01]
MVRYTVPFYFSQTATIKAQSGNHFRKGNVGQMANFDKENGDSRLTTVFSWNITGSLEMCAVATRAKSDESI